MIKQDSDKKINIVHIISGDLWAGAEVQAYSIIKRFSQLPPINIQVILFNEGILSTKLCDDGIRMYICPESQRSILSMIYDCWNIMKASRIDIVHTHGYKENLIGGIAAKLCDVKSVVRTHHGIGMLHAGWRYNVVERINAVLLTRAMISVSHDLKKELVHFGFRPENIYVIHNGTEQVKPLTPDKILCFKKEEGFDRNDIIIGTVGRLVSIKGHRDLINGAKIIIERNKTVKFVIVGEGPLSSELKSYVKELGIEANIRFMGFRKDVFRLLNIFDIFVLTSIHEGIPMALLETMSLGKPVVVTRVGGMPEIIEDNINGMLINPGDSQSFAQVVSALIEDRDLRQRLSCHAIQDASTQYSLDNTVANTLELYSNII